MSPGEEIRRLIEYEAKQPNTISVAFCQRGKEILRLVALKANREGSCSNKGRIREKREKSGPATLLA